MANAVVSSSQQAAANQTATQLLPLTSEHYVPQTMPTVLASRHVFLVSRGSVSCHRWRPFGVWGAVSLLYLTIGVQTVWLLYPESCARCATSDSRAWGRLLRVRES